MSTKIWVAYKLRKGFDVWSTCDAIRREAETSVRGILTGFYQDLLKGWEDPKRRAEATAFLGREPDKALGYFDAGSWLRKQYQQQLGSPYKDLMDLDVSVSVRKVGSKFLFIPYPGSGLLRNCLDFMKEMPQLEDYHYQNQVDRPKDISDSEWAKRRRTWDKVLDNGRWRNQLIIDIVSFSGFTDVDPAWDLAINSAEKALETSK